VALGTSVALKTVRLEHAANESALHRFRREILLARKIAHPNVCKVFELHVGGVGEPPVFLSMELLEGETLAERLRKEGRLDEGVARRIVLQIASALGAAHGEGVVHRDLKPGTVMLVPVHGGGERAVVTDFGIAHAAGALSDATTTLEGPLGTPAYMAPEQVTGGAVTPATDLYCLGVLMYELTTGTLPSPVRLRGRSLTGALVPKRPTRAPRLRG
jgi:serine/threonine protein kinase